MQLTLHDLALQYQGKVKNAPMAKDAIEDTLRDVGVQTRDIPAFTKWILEHDGKPSMEAIAETDLGKVYQMALFQQTRLVVQEPHKGDRPYWQRYTYGQFALGITSFSYKFQRNVTIRMINQIKAEYRRASAQETTGGRFKGRAKATAKASAFASRRLFTAVSMYYLSVLLTTILREAIFGQDRWDEETKEADGFPIKYLMELAWNRTGFIGAFDPWYNMIRNIRYKRSLTTYTGGGPTGSYWTEGLERAGFSFMRNSERTRTAERNRVIASYELLVLPLVLVGLTSIAVAPVTAVLFGGLAMFATSGTIKKVLADNIAGVDGKSGSKTGRGQSNYNF